MVPRQCRGQVIERLRDVTRQRRGVQCNDIDGCEREGARYGARLLIAVPASHVLNPQPRVQGTLRCGDARLYLGVLLYDPVEGRTSLLLVAGRSWDQRGHTCVSEAEDGLQQQCARQRAVALRANHGARRHGWGQHLRRDARHRTGEVNGVEAPDAGVGRSEVFGADGGHWMLLCGTQSAAPRRRASGAKCTDWCRLAAVRTPRR